MTAACVRLPPHRSLPSRAGGGRGRCTARAAADGMARLARHRLVRSAAPPLPFVRALRRRTIACARTFFHRAAARPSCRSRHAPAHALPPLAHRRCRPGIAARAERVPVAPVGLRSIGRRDSRGRRCRTNPPRPQRLCAAGRCCGGGARCVDGLQAGVILRIIDYERPEMQIGARGGLGVRGASAVRRIPSLPLCAPSDGATPARCASTPARARFALGEFSTMMV